MAKVGFHEGVISLNFEYKPPSVWEVLNTDEREELNAYAERYKTFLDASKTERESVRYIEKLAQDAGFVSFADVLAAGKNPEPGARFYLNHKNKAVVLFMAGKQPLTAGMDVVGSHIDAPRLDLKSHPLYEDSQLTLLKTHYYGGIKKYQWTCIPLSLHGIAYTEDGTEVVIRIGDDEDDPIFYITDLLPHLGKDQIAKPMSEGITGEQLNVVCGHEPLVTESAEDDSDEEADPIKEPIKARILQLLNDRYGLTEHDLLLAELELVPAANARDVGFDRSMIAAHGHDDRSCSFAAVDALTRLETIPERWSVALLVDKEEIGSVGNTSMGSRFFENAIAELLALNGDGELQLRRTFANTHVLSADVTAALDPTFPEVMDKLNSAFIGKGVCLSKFTGARGKSGSNDANSEFLQQLRELFARHNVLWQTGELGKVDQGGGGTIAYILADKGAEVVDCGVPMLSMHAPIELASKADCYMTMRAYRAFFTE